MVRKMQTNWLVGIDEVGRGPLAGPVAVGVVLVKNDFDWNTLVGVTDSKTLLESKRDAIYHLAWELRQDKKLDFAVSQVKASVIDKQGIAIAIRQALTNGLSRLMARNPNLGREAILIKLDGGLYAPKKYPKQETIIKGDSKEKVIGLASVVAKVTRDRYMRRRAKLATYAPYDFATHKGYGTKQHRASIAQSGLSPEHRKTYCRNIKVRV